VCLFCGGSCAGSGDMLMISLAAGVGLAIIKVRSVRAARARNEQTSQENEPESESVPDEESAGS